MATARVANHTDLSSDLAKVSLDVLDSRLNVPRRTDSSRGPGAFEFGLGNRYPGWSEHDL